MGQRRVDDENARRGGAGGGRHPRWSGRRFGRVQLIAWAWLCLTLLLAGPAAAQDDAARPVRLGVLAYRGLDDVTEAWQPLADYLSAAVSDPVELVPVTLSSAAVLIETGALDFLVTNPGHYLTLSHDYPVSVLATRARRLSDGTRATSFGSVLVAQKGTGLSSFADLRGAKVAAVSPRAFGGFQTVWFEAREQGVDLQTAPSEILYMGFPMDRIVQTVSSGGADMGILRSGLLERMAAEGEIDLADFEVLDPGAAYTHADRVSTRLYPEWPFLALSRTDPALVNRVALALLQSDGSGMADIWRAPVSYLPVARLLDAYAAANSGVDAPAAVQVPWPIWSAMAVTVFAILWGLVWLVRNASGRSEGLSGEAVQLTRREKQVLQLVSEGLSSKEIAQKLGVSPKTVEFHRSNLLKKFDVRSAAQLVDVAQAHLHENAQT